MEEFDFYPQKPELIEHEVKGGLASTVFSMVLFVMAFLFFFADELSIVILLLVILLIHELGHFLFMKLFGYKNVRMLFIPLMGAFVHGKKAEYSQKESFIVVGAGPFPGVILGVVLIAFSQYFNSPEMFTAGVMFLALNLINLIPLDPLDGGQLFKLLVKGSTEYFLMIFAFVSSIAIIGIGFSLNSYLLMIFGFLMAFRVRTLQKRYQMHKELINEDVNYTTTYKLLSNRDFAKIKEVIINHTPALSKYIDYADTDELNSLLASQVNSVLITPTRNDASLFFRISVILLWLFSLISPLILYYTLDSHWVSYALETWR